MRAGGCSVQQTLTPEAATVVKQAISLARRRGHAQVTPLHVANTMLSSAAGLLRAACLQSHSHPLQCKALELCFNVALNRLPASSLSKSLVIVGECLATAESVVGGVRDRVHKGEVPEVSRNLQFITLPLFSFRQMPAEEVDRKVGELRCFVKSCCVETGVVLFLKDLDWAAEYRASRGEKGRSYYCSLEHILMEIKNLALGGIVGEQHSNDKIWLMAIATYQTYSRFCRIGSPSLETLLVSPSSSSNVSSYDGHSRSLHQNQQPSLLPRKSKRPWSEHRFCLSEEAVDEVPEQQPGIKAQENAGQKLSTFPCLYLNSHPNSNSSGSTMQTELSSKFKELNAENFKFLCNALERKVTWQQDIIPEIASIILQCRSGLMRRKGKSKSLEKREETWLLFQGSDAEGKERIGRELARLVFGSSTNFITVVGHSNLSSTQSDSTDVLLQIKRSRAEASHSHLQSLFEAVRENPHRVIMMEDIEQLDHYTLTGIKRATERGKLQSYGGEEVGLCDAIIILSCESFDSRSRACSPLVKQRAESEDEKEVDAFVSLDLNLCAADEDLDDYYFDSAGLLECVDRAFFFNLPDVL
ncbi:hypothetical protein B296_00010442 [Ensete ventricosum]|uniref:Clp R domain-containing protein n=1 Tax=Ensete ventricosum TaxID=4639 RepID=A0A426ZND3_ENSVE|nr:hypothetical protein B296_00010442 [Ensete ventricosum]